MEGFTVKNSNRFLDSGQFKVSQNSDFQTKVGSTSGTTSETSFADTLKNAISEVNQLQQVSNKKMQDLSVGRTDNVADVMIAAEKADVALRVMVQVRNKIIDAYNEIMRMQL
ncbi:MAG: flagellar hook-basal body complex protein FliE [Bdellovibrionales bacterium]